jgi:hypothetical protein
MTADSQNRSKPKSLTAQIKDAERQVLVRQHGVEGGADTLVRKIHKQMTAPATLTLAGGFGFIIGELTRRQPSKSGGSADKLHAGAASPLEFALNLMSTAQTVYTALPVIWLIKSYLSKQEPDQKDNRFGCSR